MMKISSFSAAFTITALAWQPLVHGIGLGLGAAIPIGPVNVEIARRALRHGFLPGAALGLGAVTVDVIYALLSTFSFVRLLDRPAIMLPIAGCGALLLTYLGVQCLRAARAAWRVDPLDATAVSDRATVIPAGGSSIGTAYLTGFFMTLLNPMTLAFWFTVVPAMSARPGAGGVTSQAADAVLPMMCAGVFIGTVAWVLSFSTLLAIANRAAGARHDRRRRWLALADAIGGLALLSFALLVGIGFWQRLGLLL